MGVGGYSAVAHQNSGAVADQVGGPHPGAAIDGIHCGPMEGRAEHIHAHVALFWNGKPATLPAFVGIPVNQHIAGNFCFYWLHTHATTGVIHVEAPARGTYTLGQFFDVWRYTAQWDRESAIMQAPHVDDAFPNALRAAQAKDIHVYVGGTPVHTPYQEVTLANHKNITIELGTPLRPPVATYDWAHWKGL